MWNTAQEGDLITVLGHLTLEDKANSFHRIIVVLHRRESEHLVDYQLKMIKLTSK